MLIGQPKTLDDVKALTEEEVKGLIQMAESALTSGSPIDMPSMVLSILDFCRLVKAIKSSAPSPEAAEEVVLAEGRLDLTAIAVDK